MSNISAATSGKPVFGKRREPHTIIIAHGDEVSHFTFKPWMTFSIGAFLAAIAVGYLLATSYLVFRDDLIGGSISRQARIQQAYEDRIAALRAQVDRISSRQLLDQQIMEQKVAELIDRQEQLTTRGGRLGPLLERARANGASVPVTGPVDSAQQLGFAADAANTNFVSRLFSHRNGAKESASAADKADALFASIKTSIHDIESTQLAEVSGLADDAKNSAEEIKTALVSAGLPMSAKAQSAEGGPYIPAAEGQEITAFDQAVERLDNALDELDVMKSEVRRHPIANPVPGANVTSRFGYRVDPLLGTQAFHGGMDFRGASGHPVSAAAAGTVTAAGRQGGYGNMIEVRHPNGMSTRYGHLSAILVNLGDKVESGEVIGRIGSTGRSTGPHLHYEVRVDGKPVDPSRYVNIGRKIAPLL